MVQQQAQQEKYNGTAQHFTKPACVGQSFGKYHGYPHGKDEAGESHIQQGQSFPVLMQQLGHSVICIRGQIPHNHNGNGQSPKDIKGYIPCSIHQQHLYFFKS